MQTGRTRAKALFVFEAKLETYLPKEKRRHVYFNQPVRYGDHLVGRFVSKMDRKRRNLRIHSVWHEP